MICSIASYPNPRKDLNEVQVRMSDVSCWIVIEHAIAEAVSDPDLGQAECFRKSPRCSLFVKRRVFDEIMKFRDRKSRELKQDEKLEGRGKRLM